LPVRVVGECTRLAGKIERSAWEARLQAIYADHAAGGTIGSDALFKD
jgi:hypothetical protein